VPNELDRVTRALAGRYHVERELGAGGMASVYLAQDLKHRRQVAIKVLKPDIAAAVGPERFLREIETTANLRHPHILPLYDSGRMDGVLFYVMPFVDGQSLRERLRGQGQLSLDEALHIIREVADALSYAHGLGIVHRDIKPENILLSGGHAALADFGIAHALGTSSTTAVTQAALTAAGVVMGTPAYMSPEQVAAEPHVDHRSDLYSLACVLYEMLTGQPPFTGATAAVVMSRHVLDSAPPLTAARPECPDRIAQAVGRALAKRPTDRFDLVGSFVAALDLPAPDRRHHSIVVLPFANLSPDPENAFLADGLTEEVITDLSRIRALRVISRNSSMRLKGTDKDTRAIGRELGVRYVLEGSVRRSGESLRVTSQLVDADSDSQLWAERFTGTITDIFVIQEQIARKISDALAVRLSSTEDRRLGRQPFRDVQAYEWYLRARQLNLEFTTSSIGDGLVLVEKAIEREGEHAGLLALKGYLLWNRNQIANTGDLTEATRCVDRALALDPDLAMALIARAMLEIHSPAVDSGLVLRLLHRAYESDPTSDAGMWLTVYLCQTGRPEQSLVFAENAPRIDPLSGLAVLLPAFSQTFMGLHSEALAMIRHVIDRYPDDSATQFFCGQLAASLGAVDEAILALRKVSAAETWGVLASLLLQGLAGGSAEVQRLVRELGGLALVDDQVGWLVAQALTSVGAHDEAMWWLRHSAERGFVNGRFVREVDHMLAPLRCHPDMPGLLTDMGARAEAIARAAGAEEGLGPLRSLTP
jgi:eukaryotic-like serine/threonine-protein kinase